MTGADRALATRALVDDAARTLAMADVELGDPGYDAQRIERHLLDALNLTLHALAHLRGRT